MLFHTVLYYTTRSIALYVVLYCTIPRSAPAAARPRPAAARPRGAGGSGGEGEKRYYLVMTNQCLYSHTPTG